MKFQFNRALFKILLLLPLLFSTVTASSPFPSPQAADKIALSQPLTLKWHYSSELTVNLTPAAEGERIYLPLATGLLVSLRATDGELFWKTDVGGELSASPAADGRAVYVASEIGAGQNPRLQASGALRALGREGGITLWMRTLPMALRGTLLTGESNLYGGSDDGRVYALRKKSGEIAWVMQYSSPFASHPALSGSRLYIGNEDGTLFALDEARGTVLWRYRTHGAVRGQPVIVEGTVYFGSADGYVYAVNEATGRLRWRKRTGASVQTVASARTGLLVASLDNFVYCLSFNRGDRLWKRRLAGRVAAEPLTADDGALFTPLSGMAGVVLDLHDGRQLNTLPIGEDNSLTASPIVAGRVLVVTTRRGLLAFSRPG